MISDNPSQSNGRRTTQEVARKALAPGRRAALFAHSGIRDMAAECEAVGGINLALGVCDTEVHPELRQATREAIEQGPNHCSSFDGVPELRQAVADKLWRYSGLTRKPEGEILITGGATGGLHCACAALLDPGDEVILFEPYYGYHEYTLLSLDLVPRFVRLTDPTTPVRREQLEQVIGPRTRAILLNTPGNPSGKVWTRAELEVLSEVACRHELFVLTDEVYEHFVYDGREHVSPATVAGLPERTITISGFSKTFAVTGWRVGYVACDRRWAQVIGHLSDLQYICAPTPLQRGLARALETFGPSYFERLRREHQLKRDKLCEALERAGLTPRVPQGSHFVLADISRLPGADGSERAMHLLRTTGVACVPGSAFFRDGAGEHLARFCFAKEDAVLDEACRRLDRIPTLTQGAV